MKLYDVVNTIEAENKLRRELGIEEAEIIVYENDYQILTIRSVTDIVKMYRRFDPEFYNKIESANFKKSYANTLTATIEHKSKYADKPFTYIIDLFVDC